MKKIVLFIAAAFLFADAIHADRDRIIEFAQLPAKAQTFVRTNFADQKISFAKEETDLFEVSYEVVLAQGTKIEFDAKGEWKEIDCKYSVLDENLIPKQIRAYVQSQWPDAKFVKIEKGRMGYEVEITNGLELTFDNKFHLVDIDD